MPANNPLSVGYGAIWAALGAWPAFGPPLIQPGLGTQQNAQVRGFSPETTANSGDRPAIKLLEGQINGRPYQRNSKTIEFTVSYPIQLLTDEYNVDAANLLEIVTLQALVSYDGAFPGTLGNPGLINKWTIDKTGDFKQRDPVTKRPGWTLSFYITLTFTIPRADFLATTYT